MAITDEEWAKDEHWRSFSGMVRSGRLGLAPAGSDPFTAGGRALARWGKRLLAALALGLIGFALGFLVIGLMTGLILASLLVAVFAWVLRVGAPDPFYVSYLRNPTLFERSYLSGAIVFFDPRARKIYEYPMEWRHIVTELEGR